MSGTIPATLVKELRERTGVGIMECKRALGEADGDLQAAIDLLRKSSQLSADKKSNRVAAEGVALAAAENQNVVLLEVNCETDFVALDEHFQAFTKTLTEAALQNQADSVESLMQGKLEALRLELVQKLGENIQVRRLALLSGGLLGSYTHSNKRIASAVVIEGGDAALAKGLAMHVAANNPLVCDSKDVPEDVIAKEREIYLAQAQESGKSAEIIEKMVEGKVRKFLSDMSMVNQAYVLEQDQSVGDILKRQGAQLIKFVRYEVGEGIEREEIDFAAEVAAQLKS